MLQWFYGLSESSPGFCLAVSVRTSGSTGRHLLRRPHVGGVNDEIDACSVFPKEVVCFLDLPSKGQKTVCSHWQMALC